MSRRHKLRRRRNRLLVCETCKRRGAVRCYLPDTVRASYRHATTHGKPNGEREWPKPGKPDEVLCGDCASKAGYCRSCGEFCAGTESFDFHHPGYCDNCHDQMRADQDYADQYGEEDCGGDPYD